MTEGEFLLEIGVPVFILSPHQFTKLVIPHIQLVPLNLQKVVQYTVYLTPSITLCGRQSIIFLSRENALFPLLTVTTLLTQVCGFSPTLSNSLTPAQCSQFTSNTNQSQHRSHRLRAQTPQDWLHQQVSRLPTTSVQFGNKLEVPTMPTLGLIINQGSRNTEKQCTCYCQFITKDILKDIHGQADGRGTQGTVWKGPECRNFCLHGAGVYHPPGRWMCSPTQKFSKACTWGIFMKVSLYRHNQLLTPYPAPLLSGELLVRDGS